jgi:hypothetical protein
MDEEFDVILLGTGLTGEMRRLNWSQHCYTAIREAGWLAGWMHDGDAVEWETDCGSWAMLNRDD